MHKKLFLLKHGLRIILEKKKALEIISTFKKFFRNDFTIIKKINGFYTIFFLP